MAKEEKEEIKETTEEQEEKDETSEDESSEESSESKETTEESLEEELEDLDDEQKEIALNLFKALKDPKTSKTTVMNLAKNLGIDLDGGKGKSGKNKPDDTKVTDTKTGKRKSIADIVKSKFPPQWAPLGPVIAEVLEEFNSQHIDSRFTDTQVNDSEEKGNNAIEWAREKYEDFNVYEKDIEKLAEKLRPGVLKTQKDYNEYLYTLYKLAKKDGGGKTDLAKTLASVVKKTNNNAKRAKPSPSDADRVQSGSQAKTSQEAVEMALKAMRKQQK